MPCMLPICVSQNKNANTTIKLNKLSSQCNLIKNAGIHFASKHLNYDSVTITLRNFC